MSAQLDSLLKQIDLLTTDDLLQLASYAVEKARRKTPSAKARRKWKDVRGMLSYPALGEDAQAYISRTRREEDERRKQQLGHA